MTPNPSARRGYAISLGFALRAAPLAAVAQIASGIALALTPLGVLYATKTCLDAVIAGNARAGYTAAVLGGLGVGLIVLLILTYTRLVFTVVESTGRLADRELMELMGSLPGLEHFERPEHLDQSQRLREDRWMLSNAVGLTSHGLMSVVTVIGIGLLMAAVHPLLLVFPMVSAISMVFARRASRERIAAQERTSGPERLRRHLFETATDPGSAKEIRVFAALEALTDLHRRTGRAVLDDRNRALWRSARLELGEGVMSVAGMAAAIAFVLYLAASGDATGGDVLLVVGMGAMLAGSIGGVVGTTIQLLLTIRCGHRVAWLRGQARSGPEGGTAPPERLEHGIELHDVDFGYPGAETPALERVTLRLPTGAVVALVGLNGAGKTTMVKLLSGFHRPDRGRITVDGRDLAEFDPELWRQRIAASFQDYARFEFTVAETVAVGDLERTDAETAAAEALRRAGATGVLAALPGGLATRLGTKWGGTDLSGGQWQQLALGRGRMRRAPLLYLLDEPTAALDPETEHRLFQRITADTEARREIGTVTLVVSHRFSTVALADLIVVMSGGGITEVGTHQELLDSGGAYAEHYELQASSYR